MATLGPFELLDVLGLGGMATVWRARHREHAVHVALKVIKTSARNQDLFVEAIRNEVRAAARLDHPAVVRVYDAGQVSPEAAERSEDELQAGSPWFAMELVEGLSLRRMRNMIDWPVLHRSLLSILDALAHAHARGVLHRDIKPANVLAARPDGTCKLTDFGLAHALDRSEAGSLDVGFVGTPKYMAPEQMVCAWRDYGPWTDLYAVGCVGWALATGEAPFGANSDPHHQARQRLGPVPAFHPRFDVPPGLEAWLRHLLERSISRRFDSAAVAAWYLAQLPAGRDAPPSSLCTLSPFERPARLPEPLPRSESAAEPEPRWPRPELPARWELPQDRAAPTEALGLGLGLIGLRQLPVVGRARQRDALWDAFVEVARTRRARAVLLHGPAGCGKTRLAEWLGQRVGELGAGAVLSACHSPEPTPSDGLAPMLARALRCDDLPRDELPSRLAELRGGRFEGRPFDEGELVGLLAPEDEPSHGDTSISRPSPARRHPVVANVARLLAGEGTTILWLDDVQWGADALGLTRHLLAAGEDCPILIVMTARIEDLGPEQREKLLLDAVTAHPRTDVLHVGPLPPSQRPALVRELLRLSPELAAEVEERTEGNPAFAIELVGAWGQRDLLKPGPLGYELRDEAPAELPGRLEEVWRDRLERFVLERTTADRAALELAALLGGRVDLVEWRDACAAAGLPPSDRLIDELVAARLLRPAPQGVVLGWTLAHSSLQEALIEQARSGGRLAELHRACARVLLDGGSRALAGRAGHHLRLAGDLEACLEPLLDGARAAVVTWDEGTAMRCMAGRDGALTELGVPETDARWAEGWVLRAMLALNRGEYSEADQWAARVTDIDGGPGWAGPQARALLTRGQLGFRRGQADAEITLELAHRRSRDLDDERLQGDCCIALAECHRRRGSLQPAADLLDQARALFEGVGFELGVAESLVRRAAVDMQGGDIPSAARRLRSALARFERLGAPQSVAATVMALGDANRRLGDLDAAERCYRDASERLRAFGSNGWLISEFNLSLVAIAQGAWIDAENRLETVLRGAQRHGLAGLEAYTHAALMAPSAGLCHWSRFDLHTARGGELLEAMKATEWDVMWVLGVAARIARAAGQERRAVRAERLEQAQRSRLNGA